MDAEVQEMEVAGTMEEVMATEVVVGARTEVAMVAVELAEETVEAMVAEVVVEAETVVAMVAVELAEETVEEADVVEVEVGIEANTTL